MVTIQPIDFVIAWVDGSDPALREKRERYQTRKGDDIHPARYRDWNLLMYLFRGIEVFTPWVRYIYFVTDHQVPSWLNIQHPKLKITNLEDFMPPEYLPTFNIMAIEMNLHRIPGLSETFVYLMDDIYFLSPIKETYFFRNGMPRDSAVLSPAIVEKPQDVGRIVLNIMCIINPYFCKKEVIRQKPTNWLTPRYGLQLLRTFCLLPWRHLPGFFNLHLSLALVKETFAELWEKEEAALHEISTHRFRNYDRDVSIWLMQYWQLCKNRFAPISPSRGKYFDMTRMPEILRAIRKRKWPMICVNDSELVAEIEEPRQQLQEAFEEILPEKSGFER